MVEMPKVVVEAEKRGAEQARTTAKRRLTTVRGGAQRPAEKTRSETIQDAANDGSNEAWSQFLLDNSKLFKGDL